MVALSNSDRFDIWARLMRRGETLGTLTKAELRAAVDATDDWIEANQAAFNAAIPLPARSELSTQQKALLFMMVAAQKFEVA